jgi:hypothetical protein
MKYLIIASIVVALTGCGALRQSEPAEHCFGATIRDGVVYGFLVDSTHENGPVVQLVASVPRKDQHQNKILMTEYSGTDAQQWHERWVSGCEAMQTFLQKQYSNMPRSPRL